MSDNPTIEDALGVVLAETDSSTPTFVQRVAAGDYVILTEADRSAAPVRYRRIRRRRPNTGQAAPPPEPVPEVTKPVVDF